MVEVATATLDVVECVGHQAAQDKRAAQPIGRTGGNKRDTIGINNRAVLRAVQCRHEALRLLARSFITNIDGDLLLDLAWQKGERSALCGVVVWCRRREVNGHIVDLHLLCAGL